MLADTYVTVNGERSRYFGPDASYTRGGNGTINNNLNSDFFYQRIIDNGTIEHLLALRAAARPAARDQGGGARLRRRLQPLPARDRRRQHLRPALPRRGRGCAPITEMDAYRRFYQLGLIASQGVAIDGIGGAQPPTGAGRRRPTPRRAGRHDRATLKRAAAARRHRLERRSALGKDATDNGRGMMLGNPHFPWDGSERFYEAQLTIPGVDQRRGRQPVRRAARHYRPHRPPRLEPHRLDRVPLHAVRGEARAGLADDLPLRRPAAADERRGRDRHGEERRRHARAAHAHAVLDRTTGRSSPRCSGCRCSRGRRRPRSRSATRTRPTSAT